MKNNRREVKLLAGLEGEIENRHEVKFHGEQSTCWNVRRAYGNKNTHRLMVKSDRMQDVDDGQ
jgi:hypothetical protein